MEKNKNRNLKIFFEALCKHIADSIAENNQVQLKRLKSIVYTNFINNPIVRKEINLFNEIEDNCFQDRDVAKAFLNEILKVAKNINTNKLNKSIDNIIKNHNFFIKENLDISNNNLYKNTNELFLYIRKENHTIEESRIFYKSFENVINYLTNTDLNRNTDDKDTKFFAESTEILKIDLNLVLEEAVKKFNEKYSGLSPIKKEIIQDFLNFRSLDRLKSNLMSRLNKVSLQLEQFEKNNPQIEKLPQLRKNLNEYCSKVSKNLKKENINTMILNVCDFLELSEDLQKI